MRQNLQAISYCPVLYPDTTEFQNFTLYIQGIKKLYEADYGMVKIVPPLGWKPRQNSYEESLSNLTIFNPIEQNPEGGSGVYQFKHIPLPPLSYRKYVESFQKRQLAFQGKSAEELQDLFWKTLAYSPPVYGADILGTLMDQNAGSWQLNNLNTILNLGLDRNLKGVNTSYCYIGSWKALFCWHKQDLDLHAINFVHQGKSKIWYSIQTGDSGILEKQAKKLFFKGFDRCPQYLRHKTCLINPYLLERRNKNLKIHKMEQKAGQFMIVFSGAYHCGFNLGINVAEAVNFATVDWVQRLKTVNYCGCRRSSVKISFDYFLKEVSSKQQFKNNELLLRLSKENSQADQAKQILQNDSPLKKEREENEQKVIEKIGKKIQKKEKKERRNKIETKNRGYFKNGQIPRLNHTEVLQNKKDLKQIASLQQIQQNTPQKHQI